MIQVGTHQVACGQEPYIIAEIGSNWKTIEDCLFSIDEAKRCGANAVKFQFFDYKSLYGIPKGKKSSYDDSFELSIDWMPKLKQKADQASIDFMCSVFNPDHVRALDQYVYAHKIASSDINHISLLKEIGKMGKPVFLSTGAATVAEIELALAHLESVPVILMYCVANYPAKHTDLTLLQALKNYSEYVGFSDHSLDANYLPYAAVKFHQACALEKHFTAIESKTPDSEHSLNPAQFRSMVERIKDRKKSILGPTLEENDMVLRHKRRFLAVAEIKQGDVLKLNKNFGAYRSLEFDSKGLRPLDLHYIEGKRAARDIDLGCPIAKLDCE